MFTAALDESGYPSEDVRVNHEYLTFTGLKLDEKVFSTPYVSVKAQNSINGKIFD
jgi:hypothetical protein